MRKPMNRRSLLQGASVGAVAMVLSGCALPRATSSVAGSPPNIGTWGFDLAGMDRSINPGDDFFRFAGGTWMKNTKIPDDRSRWGSFNELGAKSEEDVRSVVEEATRSNPAPGSVERKVVDYFEAYSNVAAINAKGLSPAKADLDRIGGLKTHEDLATLWASPGFRGQLPVGMGVTLDAKRPDVYVISIGQSGLGMPDRDYYLKPDEKFASIRTKYTDYVGTMLKLAGHRGADRKAREILALETRIATIHWPRDKSRNRDLTYNPKSRAELLAFAPAFPWQAAFDSFGAPQQDFFVVSQSDAVQGLATLFRETPVALWRNYLTFHYLNAFAEVLPAAFDDAAFGFNGKVVTGQPQQRDRWKRAVTAMSGTPYNAPMGEAVGQLYVRKTFTPRAKAEMAKLVENLRAAYKVRIRKLSWMSEETKVAALTKLEKIRVKIGYPDAWRDYTDLEIVAGDAFGNHKRELAFTRKRDLKRLAEGADRSEWGMAPQTVNAYYSSVWNEIVFPAAILQAPFFDVNADPAVNYGGIGAVIGHEMGHGFDDQGSKSDGDGILRKWWNAEDETRFKVLGDKLAAQYGKFEALPGLFLNGRLSLGENIGDLGGLNVALEGYLISIAGREPPVLDGFTGLQRFFLGFGQIWRTLMREEAMRNQVISGPHSPGEFRANGTVRNMDAWYQAFGVKPDAKLYVPPEERVRIW
jgi:predicted metalloendopeptidase